MPNSVPTISGPSFSQSSAIAFSILIGFVVFITCRGELGKYFQVFLGTGGAGDNPGAASATGSGGSGGLLSGLTGGSSLLGGGSGGGASSLLSGGDTGFVDLPSSITNLGGVSGGSGADAVINVSGNASADNAADGLANSEFDLGLAPD